MSNVQGYNEEVLRFLEEEERKEHNHERRYYRHNLSLEYLQEKEVPIEFQYLQSKSVIENDVEEVLSFLDWIEDCYLLEALKALKSSDLEIIELRYRFGLSIHEIALKLNMKDETAKKKHQRAVFKLKQHFEKNK